MKRPITKALVLAIVGSIAISLLYALFVSHIINDENSIGWILGGLFTMYSLITAFVLVNVWEKFNKLNELISREAQKLISIWNLVDYLNDSKISAKMQKAIGKYLDFVLNTELTRIAKNMPVKLATQDFINIMRVTDSIEFDDKRDASAFQKIIETYENLSTVRADRIQLGLERIPPMLQRFFRIMTGMLLGTVILHPFNNFVLYILAVFSMIFITTLIYYIITDLDNPFVGVWNIDPTPYKEAKEYINSVDHRE